MNPRRRERDLISQELTDEIVIYDRLSEKAHCLNGSASLVWRLCDGSNTVSQIARRLAAGTGLPADEGVVLSALRQLHEAKLLEAEPEASFTAPLPSRRDVAKRLGLGTALAMTLPAIMSIPAPAAAQAASLLPIDAACAHSYQCQSGCCRSGRCKTGIGDCTP